MTFWHSNRILKPDFCLVNQIIALEEDFISSKESWRALPFNTCGAGVVSSIPSREGAPESNQAKFWGRVRKKVPMTTEIKRRHSLCILCFMGGWEPAYALLSILGLRRPRGGRKCPIIWWEHWRPKDSHPAPLSEASEEASCKGVLCVNMG